MDRIEIALFDDYQLVVERNTNPDYNKELFIGINKGNAWYQDLAIVRPSYGYDGDKVVWQMGWFDVLVYSDANCEDYTHGFKVELYQGEEE